MNVDMAMLFGDFVSERHRIWERRQAGTAQPWTADPVLADWKFTNVFRVLDPGSQFVFELAPPEDEPRDVLARLFLYRHTNLPSAWRAYAAETGGYPTLADLDDLLKFWRSYRDRGGRLFSGAYMVYPQSAEKGTEKIVSVVELTKRLEREGVLYAAVDSAHLAGRFRVLRANKGVADFMSMQIATDWGYTAQCGEDDENEFVIPGPGSRRGAEIVRPGEKPVSTIEWAHTILQTGPKLPNGRPLSLMDVQNCFCEFSKYVRYLDRKLPGNYQPAHPGPQPAPVLPTHWG